MAPRKSRQKREAEFIKEYARVAEEFFRKTNPEWSDEKVARKVRRSVDEKKKLLKIGNEVNRRLEIFRQSLLKTRLSDKNLNFVGQEYAQYLIKENKKFLGLEEPTPHNDQYAQDDAGRAKALADMTPEDAAKYAPRVWEKPDSSNSENKGEEVSAQELHEKFCKDTVLKYAKRKHQLEARKRIMESVIEGARPKMESEVRLEFKLRREMEFVREDLIKKGFHGKDLDKKVEARFKSRFETITRLGYDPEEMDAKQLLQAEKIWLDLCSIPRGTPEDKSEHIQKQYKEFFQTFPVVSRYMAEGFFEPVAFKRLMVRLRGSSGKEMDKGKRMDEWLENQAMYAKYLTQELGKRKGEHDAHKRAKQVFQKVHEALLEDRNSIREGFKKHHDTMSEEFKKSVADYASHLRSQMLSHDAPAVMEPQDVTDLDRVLSSCLAKVARDSSPSTLASAVPVDSEQ